jgi:hypothetical protein
MKKGLCLLVALAVVMLGPLSVYAVSTSGPISVSASIVAGTPDMTVVIHKIPKGDWTQINFNDTAETAMTFDKFTIADRTVGGNPVSQWTSVDVWAAFVYADGIGSKYQITSTGTGTFTSGANTLPGSSFACIPVYTPNDQFKYPDGTLHAQGAMPSGAVLGTEGPALVSNKLVYTSEAPAGSARILQVQYAFPPYNTDGSVPYVGYAPIPSSQVNGTYTGVTVTVNIAPI